MAELRRIAEIMPSRNANNDGEDQRRQPQLNGRGQTFDHDDRHRPAEADRIAKVPFEDVFHVDHELNGDGFIEAVLDGAKRSQISAVAFSPRMALQGSPGIERARLKVTTKIPNNTGMASKNRRIVYWIIDLSIFGRFKLLYCNAIVSD